MNSNKKTYKKMKTKLLSLLFALVVGVNTVDAQMTVNGRPATKEEKAVAGQMVKQGVQMAKKGAQMAVTAVANPSKTDEIEKELEKMGEEMERLGDSLEKMAEDTTFLYGDSLELAGDSIEITADNLDDFIRGLEDGMGSPFPAWMHTWWGKIIAGCLGLIGGIFAILLAIFIIVLLFGIFTAPLWVVALVVWLLVRNTKKTNSQEYMRYQTPHPGRQGAPNQAASVGGQASTAQNAAQNTSSSAQDATTGQGSYASTDGQPSAGTASDQPEYMTSEYNNNVPDERREMWNSGIMYACIGVGLGILFYSLGMDVLWGIGALVACIGIAKIIIASTRPK